MISDAMKRNIPSTRASTRELWCARRAGRGGSAAACALRPSPRRARLDDDVLDRDAACRSRSRPTRSRRSQPERCSGKVETMISSTRSSRDGLHRRRVRIGVRDLAVRLDPLAAQLGERAPQPPLGVGVRRRASGRSAGRRSGSSPARCAARSRIALEQRLAEHRLVRDARGRSARRPPRRDVGRRRARPGPAAGGLPDLVEEVPPQPARLLLRVRRDDDLVRRLELRDRVADARQPGRCRRRARARGCPPRGAARASGRAGGRPRRAACPRRRRSPRAGR